MPFTKLSDIVDIVYEDILMKRYSIKDQIIYGDDMTLRDVENIGDFQTEDVGRTHRGNFDGKEVFICEMFQGMVAVQVGNEFATINRLELHDFVSSRV